MRPIRLVFHPKETCYPTHCFRTTIDHLLFPMDSATYNSETYQFVYKENLGTGLFGLFPKSKALGYHAGDIERITYYYTVKNRKLVKVMISAHSNEYHVLNIPEDDDPNEPITIYVAKGSHAFYPNPGVHWRIMGFANDVCGEGAVKIYTEADVKELTEPQKVEFGLIVEPTGQLPYKILDDWQRFWLPVYAP